MAEGWRRCSACKQPIEFGAAYWVCNVSTCNRKRTGMVFCSDDCWGVHLPSANHREAWTIEKRAPSQAEAAAETAAATAKANAKAAAANEKASAKASQPARRIVPSASSPTRSGGDEVLIVASRLKNFIRETSGFNTSDGVLEPLSQIVRKVCQDAIRNAERDGRKTILDRDVPKS